MATIKLNSVQILEDISIAYGSENAPKQAKATAKELAADPNAKGKLYRTVVYKKVAFNIDETTFQQLQDGELAVMVLEDSMREVVTTDDQTGEETKAQVPQLQFIKAITKKAMLATKRYDAEVSMIDRVVAKEYGLDTQKIAALEAVAI